MKIRLITVAVLTICMLQFSGVKANHLSVTPTFMQLPPPPPRPPAPHIGNPFRHRHHRMHRSSGRISVHLPPHPQGPPPPPPRP